MLLSSTGSFALARPRAIIKQHEGPNVLLREPGAVPYALRQGRVLPTFQAGDTHYSELEKRLRMLIPLLAVPVLRYSQDEKDQRNQLFVRDFGSTFSSTMIYFTAVALYASACKHIFKVPMPSKAAEFLTHVPAQVTALTASAFVGPRLSTYLFDKAKEVKESFASGSPVQQIKDWWQQEVDTKRASTHLLSLTIAATLFSATVPPLMSLIKLGKDSALNKSFFDKAVSFWVTELPVLVSMGELSLFAAYQLDRWLCKRSQSNDAKNKGHVVLASEADPSVVDSMQIRVRRQAVSSTVMAKEVR
jgi:hypothetical protein